MSAGGSACLGFTRRAAVDLDFPDLGLVARRAAKVAGTSDIPAISNT
jgi:hypothetical protein